MKLTSRRTSVVVAIILIVSLLTACSAKNLSVKDVWARPGLAGGTSAIYFVVDNPSGQADTLKAVKCDAGMMAQMHLSKMDDAGAMTMIEQESVPVAANSSVEFKPGGLHVMLMDLKTDLKTGDKIKAVLTFEKAGDITIQAEVKQP